MNKPGCIIPAAQLSSRFRGPGPRCLRRASGADLRGAAVDRRGQAGPGRGESLGSRHDARDREERERG